MKTKHLNKKSRVNKKRNKQFRIENPMIELPPDYLIYEAFQIDYKKYYTDSIETAQWLKKHFEKHCELKNKRILDWGCGPGRIIRHLPQIIGNNCEFYGTDYNAKSIDWCKKNIPSAQFNLNTIEAKLPYPDHFFDVIYGISIFTHLSEEMHFAWKNELLRILKPGGIMFQTLHGDNFISKLTETEKQNFADGRLITRGHVKEGHRTYTAYHPEAFVRQLFSDTEILEHIVINPVHAKVAPQQDIWIVKKP